MLDLRQEFEQPTEDPGWIVKVIIGGVLMMASHWQWLFFLLAFFSLGYIYRYFKSRLEKVDEGLLPEWRSWQDLFIKGIVIFLIFFGYFLIPRISYEVTDSILMGGVLAKLVALIFMAITALLYVAALFLIPMAIAEYTKSDQISTAFNLKSVWNKIMDVGDDYFKAVLLTIVTIIALYIIRLFPVIGPIAGALVGFYAALVIASTYGQICRQAYAEESTASTEPAPAAAQIPEAEAREREAVEPEASGPQERASEPAETDAPEPAADEADAAESKTHKPGAAEPDKP
ncbi:MAG: DUF4013 domain-containing protein [bacterium]|nr:DUF4013 domain-containing protein [bacterium]